MYLIRKISIRLHVPVEKKILRYPGMDTFPIKNSISTFHVWKRRILTPD